MLLNPPLPRPQLLEGLLACTPRRPIRVAWCHPLDPGARATQVGGFIFGPREPQLCTLQVQAE